MIERYLTQTQFTSYDDFCKNLHINIPERFNFAYDVVDRMAAGEPGRPALLWTDETGAERRFTLARCRRSPTALRPSSRVSASATATV